MITRAGEQMAHDYGKMLKDKYVKELEEVVGGKFDEVIVQASPYLRTMMTAANLCRGLGIGHFTCNYMYCEYQENKVQYSGKCEIPNLTSKTQEKQAFITKFLGKNIDFTDDGLHEPYIMTKFPENDKNI